MTGKTPGENKQYLLLDCQECDRLFGYFKDNKWYANADEDYPLRSSPASFKEISDPVTELVDKGIKTEPERYQLVQLADGRYQIAFLEKKYPWKAQQDWHLDVFDTVTLTQEKVHGAIIES